jgi:ubiquinone/menaquinone biosynthesis C-methylase UbiE
MTSVSLQPSFTSRLVNGLLAIKPLAQFAKNQARTMMIERAEKMGVPWRNNVESLSNHDWEKEKALIENPELTYPDYYLASFHAYDKGNLEWLAAWEVESAAYAVHSTIWKETDGVNLQGDSKLRQAYHRVLLEQINPAPQTILDIGCSVGMSTFALAELYPQAQITGLDLSPYYLAVANYQSQKQNKPVTWVHAAGENTGLPAQSFDFVSAFLIFHELPQSAAQGILKEAHRLLKPGGYLGIMDMNPFSEIYRQMPPYILTLLKSTEPYLDQYFTLDINQAFLEAGFHAPTITPISPRHRAVVAQVSAFDTVGSM